MGYTAPFITVEGVDGAGKSSHMQVIMDQLSRAGFECILTKEPGGTPLGERLRLEFKTTPMSLTTETLLAFASRAEHLEQVIRPGLSAGKAVVSDRFTDSTFAYQAAANGYPWEHVEALEAMVQGGLQPDLTLFFDLAPDQAASRRQRRGASVAGEDVSKDKFEANGPDWFEAARAGYLRRLEQSEGRMRVIDSSGPIEDVARRVAQTVDDFLQRWIMQPRTRAGLGRSMSGTRPGA